MTDFEMRGSVLRKYHGKGGAVVLPDSVTEIYVCAFCGRDDITSITFPASLVKIGERAFSHCTGITSLDFPDSLVEIDREAFAGCTGLSSVHIPRSVRVLGFYAFHDCSSLKHIVSPANVLGDWPFPKTLETAELIGGSQLSKGAFTNFTQLRAVTLTDSLTFIGIEAFKGCEALEEIRIPDSVTEISVEAFADCTRLSKVTLGRSLHRIEREAFSGCTALTSLRFPASTVKIAQNAFLGCTSLASCTFDDTNRWCRIPPNKYWVPYNTVEEPDIDVSDPRANAATVTDLADTLLFKKRAVPRPDPAGPRFLTPVSERAENGLFVQGQYFACLAPDEDTEAALWEQANQLSICRTEETEHDHDEYGRYTDVETTYYPLTNCRALTAPHSAYNADIIVEDGKVVGVILCRAFSGTRDAYEDWLISLPNSPEDSGANLILLYSDGRVVGENVSKCSDHSGRDFTDSSIEYKLSTKAGGKTERNATWG